MEALAILVGILIVLALLGIVVAFSPTLIIAEIAILTRAKDPVRRTLALIAGIATAVTIFSLLALLFIEPTRHITLPSTRDVFDLVPIFDIIVGVLLMFVGLKLLRPAHPKPKAAESAFERRMSPSALYWFGLIKMGTSLSSITAIIIATRLINTYTRTNPVQAVAALWLVAISMLPFVLLILSKQYRPQLFGRIQDMSDRAVSLNWRRYIAGAIMLLSVWFMVVGLRNL